MVEGEVDIFQPKGIKSPARSIYTVVHEVLTTITTKSKVSEGIIIFEDALEMELIIIRIHTYLKPALRENLSCYEMVYPSPKLEFYGCRLHIGFPKSD